MSEMDTTIRVKNETHKSIVKARGALEQTFGRKLTLDETVFVSASYVNIAYEELQKLETKNLAKVITEKDGSIEIKWTDLGQILIEVLPRLMTAFANLKRILNRKSNILSISSGQVS
jgi:hypothetical protein